jgi:hypothetical protein
VVTAEPLARCWRNLPVSFHFDYPVSWQAMETFTGQDHCALNLINDYEGVCAGRIVLEVHRRNATQSAARMIQVYTEELQRMGVRRNGSPVISTKPTPDFAAAWVYVPAATYQEQSIDIPVLVFEHPLAVVLLGLIGPSKQTSPEWWAINKRAFEIVRDSLRICGPAAMAEQAQVMTKENSER